MTDEWDAAAATFDDEADHGLRDPEVRASWRALLLDVLPPAPASVADLACGTGSLTLLLAEEGYAVTGVDAAERMLEQARRKVGDAADLVLADVVEPPLSRRGFDVVLARHVLFALPRPEDVLGRWVDLLAPGGRLVLVEGFWSTGSGLHATDVERMLRLHRAEVEVRPLVDPALWGRAVADERYLVLSRR